MRVRVDDGTWQELGTERYTIEWHTLKPGVMDDGIESPDPDLDFICHMRAYVSLSAARRAARTILSRGLSYHGQVIVQRQRVAWFVEEDCLAEWADIGEPEYFD